MSEPLKMPKKVSLLFAVLVVSSLLVGGGFRIDPNSPLIPNWEPSQGLKTAKGPTFSGVVVLELEGLTESTASSIWLTSRLTTGTTTHAVAAVTGSVDVWAVPDVQNTVLEALEPQIKGSFFPNECGWDGLSCPRASLLLRSLSELSLTTNDRGNQIAVGDIQLQLSQTP